MTIEHAIATPKRKPWGSLDLRPWSQVSTTSGAIGELWFERSDASPYAALLLKILFTREPLSIQVHPDDAFARSIGLSNGKNEAWYILSADAGAQVAVGLNRSCSSDELRSAITDGTIADMVHWRPVRPNDVIFIPAGTIHAIGAGIVLAEIQQHSDSTFRLFDYGRNRELHIDNAVAVATAGPSTVQSPAKRLSDARTALTVNPHFVLERLDLAPSSFWVLDASKETWLLAIQGHAEIGSTDLQAGEAVFVQTERADIKAGNDGLKALLAYRGPHVDFDILKHGDLSALRSGASSGAPSAPILSTKAAPQLSEKRTW